MICSEVQASLSLYLYGELDFAAEEGIENHLSDCPFCELSLNREKEWHAAVNRRQQDVTPEWLSACRADLSRNIANEPTSARHLRNAVAEWLRSTFDFRITERSYRLAAISSLLIIGFGAGKMAGRLGFSPDQVVMGRQAGFLQPSITRVQAIRPEADNQVRIVLQKVQVREVVGSRDDEGVRTLLLSAAQESLDPGVRMDSVEMLAGQDTLQIRDALVHAIAKDANAAVRVKAIESLRRIPSDAVTRDALEFALAHDPDAGVRTEAINVLVPAGENLPLTPQLKQTISNVMRSAASDDYVRSRCAQILDAQAFANGVY